MIPRILATTLVLCLWVPWARTEEKTPPPQPRLPLVTELPPGSTYTIQITYADTPPPASAAAGQTAPVAKNMGDRPVSVQVWRDAKRRRILVKHADGTKSEGYLFDSGFVVRSTSDSDQTFVSPGSHGREASLELFTKDFQGTQWLDMRHYTGVQTEGGKEVFVFHQPAGVAPTAASEADGIPLSYRPLDYMELHAHLRVGDQSPAMIRLGTATYTFSPVQPWSGSITMPDQFRSTTDSYSKELSVLEALRKKKKPQP